ncbi:pectinesterase family protein [Clostridium sp.]|uniref:pectinesterase family protein n=1 Tax=Clostridium sp. TaxID=1506 RepID=UPI002842DCFB|nr:pectinesterase family protein [Clostridium sp.]MDR3595042.1 pectinesterase family protein [Clostridium sp.]
MGKKSLSFVILGVLTTSLIFGGCASNKDSKDTSSATAKYNVIVDSKFSGNDGSKEDGTPTYKTLTSAIDQAPTDSSSQYTIYIKDGTYYEKVTIDKPNISLIGEDIDKTKLTYDVASGTKKSDGTTYGTFDSASVSVIAPNFSAENLTFENGFDYPVNKAKADTDSTKLKDAQAVALKFDKDSNKAYIKNCKITGYQDTLYSNAGTQYYKNCTIVGCIDFIFGAGQGFFNNCNIVSIDMKSPNQNGYITAASTNAKNKYGFVFYKCNIKAESDSMSKNSVALGRPWHPTTTFEGGVRKADPYAIGSVIYLNCNLGDHIKTTGWDKMSGKDENGNVIWFTPEDSRFYEYGSNGPGSVDTALATRKFLSDSEAKDCTEKNVLNGWEPQ